jgi:hypothetical protein
MYASDRMAEPTARIEPTFQPENNRASTSDAMTPVSAQAVPRTEFAANSTAQTVMRNAYAADMRSRSVFTAGSGTEVGAFGLNVNDPDYEQKKFFHSIYGTDYFRGKGSEPTPVEKAAFSVFAPQALGLPGMRVRNESDRFEKPASDRFNFNSALLLNTPVSLMNAGTMVRRDGTGRIISGPASFNGPGMTGSRLPSDSKQVVSSLTASANEGGVGRGQVGAEEEQTEADILEQGGAITATVSNANHDDEDDDAQDMGVPSSTNEPASSQTVVASSVASGDPDNDPIVSDSARTIMQGPPRKRQRTNQAV